jgi:hypothetical protein
MAKQRAKSKEGLMKVWAIAWPSLLLIGSIATVGWGASEYMATYAKKNEVEKVSQRVEVVQVQVKSVWDIRIEALMIQRDRILRKQQKTPQDNQALQEIEKELEIARRMRDIK